MKSKIEIKYLFFYAILNIIGITIASKFWWTDSLNLSFLKQETFFLLFSVGICWIGILYLTILIIRKFIVRVDDLDFFGPIDLISNEIYHKEIGTKNAVKFKNSISFIAFPILIITILTFLGLTNFYSISQIKNYGKIENVIVKEIRFDIKQNPYIFFYYNNDKNQTNLLNERKLKVGSRTKIIYSKNNPKIIEYYNE